MSDPPNRPARVAGGAAQGRNRKCGAVRALQLVPYGWRHENPPDRAVAPFPSQQSAALWKSACADCHSNRTNWPAWSFVAPFSWLVRSDVEEGREEFNVSDWDRYRHDADDAAEEIEDGSMPPSKYTLLHPDAKLTDAEKQLLIDTFPRDGAALRVIYQPRRGQPSLSGQMPSMALRRRSRVTPRSVAISRMRVLAS